MSKRPLPYIFLAFLFAILLFILGIRYGREVEKVNKTVSYVLNLPPSITSAPTAQPLTFANYVHSGCKTSFLIPNELEKTKEGSTSALFSTRKGSLGVALSCEKKVFVKEEKEIQIMLNKTIRAYETQTKDTSSYRFYHVDIAQVVTITVAKQYLPLLQTSLAIGN